MDKNGQSREGGSGRQQIWGVFGKLQSSSRSRSRSRRVRDGGGYTRHGQPAAVKLPVTTALESHPDIGSVIPNL